LVVLLLTAGASSLYYGYSLKPNYKGTAKISGLQDEVNIYYDHYGIPHIYATNDLDAMTALGYVHAQDRLWQMDLVSRIAAGRLAEIFGEKLINTDKFYLSLGISVNSKEIVKNIDKNTVFYKQSMAYLKGVNDFIENGATPIEYSLIGVPKKKMTLEDIYNVFGYMSYGFAMANKTDPLLSAIQEKLGNDYVNNLNFGVNLNNTLIKTYPTQEAVALSKVVREMQNQSPLPPFIGSNSWVVGPEKTKNGKVIFANDPHIGFSQPAVWYQAHINTPTTEIYGFYLALTPYPLLGHNHKIAYGLTMFENDDIDLYIEKVNPENPDEYLYNNTYKKFKKRKVFIPVKDADTVYFTVRESLHGPIINDVVPQVKTEAPVAMYWVYTQRPNKLLEASYFMSRATNLEEFKKGPELIHAPGLNVMYGDADGNVAWWAAANLYERDNNAPTKLLLEGSNPDNNQINYKPFSENPQAINPPWHYVYSCNNQPDSTVSKRYIPGYYLTQDRAKRVVQLLDGKENWTQKDMETMINDVTSSVAPELVQILIANLQNTVLDSTESKALQQLKDWDGAATLKSIGTTIYTQFHYEYLQAVLKDELGDDIYNLLSDTHLMGRMIEPLMKGKKPIWIDDVNTPDTIETNANRQQLSFKKAVATLKEHLGSEVSSWTWDKVHTVEHPHPLGKVAAFRPYFNVGPFPINGTNEVLNNQIFSYKGTPKYDVHGGPSTRRIIDFSDVENAKAISPTGQSGNVISAHYKDQAQLYLEGKFIPMLLRKETIQKSEDKLTLQPE
ncbi:MAG TPA: penicillin acylase family protein, partial [Saprospiraceae bacterium]|nr:penicillin acylase family protein [Saprospiraceae bacterium]